MSLPSSLVDALARAGLSVLRDAPLRKRTWWRAGGPADGLVDVDTLDGLIATQQAARAAGVPIFVLGNASNLLVADAGVRGLVVRLTGALADCTLESGAPPSAALLVCGGGLKLAVLQGRMLKHGWTGLEAIAGVPGTIGGAVRMNAGTTLGEVKDNLHDVTVVHSDGLVERLPVDALAMTYRTCVLPDGAIVAFARFRLTDDDADAMRARVTHHLQRRRDTQPIDQPSCGSTFRNPPGDHAGRLIEAAGLKGYRRGDAQVSTKHANFIVNLGDASAADIRAVIEHVQAEVSRQFGVTLAREVHYAGDWGDRAQSNDAP